MTEPSNLAERWGRAVRSRREALGLSIEDLSDRCGLTPTFIAELESGRGDPTVSVMTALAIGLQCEARDLVPMDDVLSRGPGAEVLALATPGRARQH